MSIFSERLIHLRKCSNLSQASVAEGIRLSMRAYQKYEYEESEPKLSVAARIADFYGVSLDYLAGRSEER